MRVSKQAVFKTGVLLFLGYGLQAQTNANDSLKQQEIEEVVIVGFGQKKSIKEITGSVGTMSAKSFKEQPITSVDKALMGNIAGVQTGTTSGQPGSMTEVRVRGIASVKGGLNPVFIVDGVRVSSGDLTRYNTTANALSSLNSDDIESVTVLKDAVSTSLYGADSGAGVIIITTKSGRSGKTRFTFNNSHGFNNRAVEGPRAINTSQFLDVVAQAFVNSGYYDNKNEAYHALVNPNIDVMGWSAYSNNNTDWRSIIDKKSSYQSDFNFSASGGADRFKYYSSLGYFTQEANVKNSNFKRLSASTKLEYKATDRLNINTDFQFSNSKMYTLAGGGQYSNPILNEYFANPMDTAYNEDGSLNLGTNSFSAVSGIFNIAALSRYNYLRANTNRFFANVRLDYRILRNLKYKFVFAPEFFSIEEDSYSSPLHGEGFRSRGSLTQADTRRFSFNVQNILEYNFRLGYDNSLTARAIQEAYKTDSRFLAATAEKTGSHVFQTLDSFIKPTSARGQKIVNSRAGYALQLAYNFKRLLNVDLAFRNDNISNFLPGQKSGNFWSAGAGFDFARLEAFDSQNVLSQLKLRSSYGKLGNQISSSPYATYAFGLNYDGNPGLTYSGVYNPNLKWETVSPFNVGFDFGLFKNRLTLTAEYYNKKTTDLVFTIPLQRSQGLANFDDNVGSLVNKGFEFSFSADLLKGNGNDSPNLNISGNFSTLNNKMMKIYGDLPITTSTTILAVGESVNAWYMRKWAGVDPNNGDPLWYVNGVSGETTNVFSLAKQAVQGTPFNKYFGGASINAGYKNISLGAQFQYGFGSKIFDNWAAYFQNDGAYYTSGYAGYNTQADYWTLENPNASNPKPMIGGNKISNGASTRFLYKGDFIRLNNVKLAYDFKRDFLEGTSINGLQLYVLANNYWTHVFDKNFKFDPQSAVGGTTNLNLPIPKSLVFGVSANF